MSSFPCIRPRCCRVSCDSQVQISLFWRGSCMYSTSSSVSHSLYGNIPRQQCLTARKTPVTHTACWQPGSLLVYLQGDQLASTWALTAVQDAASASASASGTVGDIAYCSRCGGLRRTDGSARGAAMAAVVRVAHAALFQKPRPRQGRSPARYSRARPVGSVCAQVFAGGNRV